MRFLRDCSWDECPTITGTYLSAISKDEYHIGVSGTYTNTHLREVMRGRSFLVLAVSIFFCRSVLATNLRSKLPDLG